MQTIIVRKAAAVDLATLLGFQQGIVDAERPFDSTIKEGPVHYYDIPALLASDDVLFVIAEAGAIAVGCGFARIDGAKPYLKHALEAYLGLMYVDPAYRGQSVNRKIIDVLKAWCASRGITEMRLDVYPGNSAAIRAYQKAGFRPLMLEMRLALDP